MPTVGSGSRVSECFLVTGALGCLGAWTVSLLLGESTNVVTFDVSEDDHRLRLLLSDREVESLRSVRGDVTDADQLRAVVESERITHIVHLAALQVPFCRADPVRGAQVNVVGTVNVFEAVRSLGDQVEGLSYASSIAVFGPAESYPDGVVGEDALPAPRTLYGAYKLANEWTARVYAADHGIGSVGVRPSVVFGPGRDQGLTSGATMAMLAAAAGVPYRIGHGGRLLFQYAPDVARVLIGTARARSAEAQVLNVGGTSAPVPRLIQAIERAAPEAAGTITFEEAPLPFPEDLDASDLDGLLGTVAYTPLDDGVRHTIAAFKQLLARGLIQPPG